MPTPSLQKETGSLKSGKSQLKPKLVKKAIKKAIKWQAPSFYYTPQKRYLAMIIVALLLAAGAILFFSRDILTAIFLILSSLVLVIYANKKPEINPITIDDHGIHVGENSYFYQELKSFWIEYDPVREKELSLESKKWYVPYVKISLESQNPIEIRSWLISFMPEREHEHSLIDLLGKKLGL